MPTTRERIEKGNIILNNFFDEMTQIPGSRTQPRTHEGGWR